MHHPNAKSFRTLAIYLLFLSATSVTSQEDTWGKNLVAFNNVYCAYFKKYWGCAPLATDPATCHPSLGTRDFRQEEEMIKAWDKLIKETK